MTDKKPNRKIGLFDGMSKREAIGTVIGLVVGAISVAGLCIAAYGKATWDDTTYFIGLCLAAPLYISMIPVSLLLVATVVIGLIQMFRDVWRWLVGRLRKRE